MILIDDDDYELLSQRSWRLDSYGYATWRKWGAKLGANKGPSWVKMHRLVMGYPRDIVDHIDGNKLNNQKANLRICTVAENGRNRKPKNGYKGVRVWKKCFAALISVDSKQVHLGSFRTARQAAMVYDMWATFFYGQYAHTNFKPVLLN